MREFVLINLRDEKKVNRYNINRSWKQSVLLPYYGEGYVCFGRNKNYTFEVLILLFFYGNEDEQIGAISMIAENYPNELYKHICNQRDCFPPDKIRFILNVVVPSYLPLRLPKERLGDYNFDEKYTNNIWVKILEVIRPYALDPKTGL